MNDTVRRSRRLRLLSLTCFILLIPATLVWLVNLELAARAMAPGCVLLERLLPPVLFQPLASLSADLSTVSTLVPLLLLLFPCVMARRILRYGAEEAEERLQRLVYDPYPPHFPFFLVMLGLAGTLYGLLIGLDVSGVAELGNAIPSPETIQATLDQLLDGTATALLSSLWGMIGAFLAARPLTWFFHRAALLPSQDEPVSLSGTLHALIEDMRSLGASSREFGERLGHTAIEDLPATLRDIRDALQGLRGELTEANRKIESLGQAQSTGQALLQPLTQLGELQRLASLETLLGQLGEGQRAGQNLQSQSIEVQREAHAQRGEHARQHAEAAQAQQQRLDDIARTLEQLDAQARQERELLEKLHAELQRFASQGGDFARQAGEQGRHMIALLEAGQEDRETDRRALRLAFGRFLEGGQAAPPSAEDAASS